MALFKASAFVWALIFLTKLRFPLGTSIAIVLKDHSYLSVKLTANLSWKAHIVNIFKNANKKLNMLKDLKFKVGRHSRPAI